MILSSTYLASTCVGYLRSCIRTRDVLRSIDGDGILLNCRTYAANDAYGSRSGDRRPVFKRSAPGCPTLPGAFMTSFQTSRACASSLRRVNALRGTINSRIPISSLRTHVRDTHAGLRAVGRAMPPAAAKPLSSRLHTFKPVISFSSGTRRLRQML